MTSRREQQARQLALAIRDEVVDLEAAGIRIIQIDEAAFREGLPLRKRTGKAYLDWATEAFRLCASGVRDETQIHTHMCYSEFNDVIESIAAMDADVITIETSRSDMELLEAFERFDYPNEIGPGVYDIHSPRVPDSSEMVRLMKKAAQRSSRRAPVGQPGLRPEDPWLGGDRGGAGEHGGGGTAATGGTGLTSYLAFRSPLCGRGGSAIPLPSPLP